MNTIKQQCVVRILELLDELVVTGTLRKAARRSHVLFLETVLPAAHLVIGDESLIGEDHVGYTMQFPADIKLMFKTGGEAFAAAEELVGEVQAKIESDLQLNALANSITYQGDAPFTNDINAADGGTVVSYLVQYRRKRADPEGNY